MPCVSGRRIGLCFNDGVLWYFGVVDVLLALVNAGKLADATRVGDSNLMDSEIQQFKKVFTLQPTLPDLFFTIQ